MNLIDKAQAYEWEFLQLSETGYSGIGALADVVVRIVLEVAAVLAVIYLIYSGILYLTAAGNPDAAKKGQQGLVNAIIGIVIIILAYVIVTVIASTVTRI